MSWLLHLHETQLIAHEGCAGIVAVYLKISRMIIVPDRLLARGDLRHHGDCSLRLFLSDRDFHSFAGKHRVGEPFLTQLFDAQEKVVVVLGVVMCEG